MNIYINNTRTLSDYHSNPHHHDFMLANRCMAGANRDQHKVDIPKTGDVVALYANGLGLIAFGIATDEVASLDDERVGRHPTKVRRLREFRRLAFPVHHTEYATSNSQTLQEVKEDKEAFWRLLNDRAEPEPSDGLFHSPGVSAGLSSSDES